MATFYDDSDSPQTETMHTEYPRVHIASPGSEQTYPFSESEATYAVPESEQNYGASWNEHSYGGMEVINPPTDGIEVNRMSGIEVDRDRRHPDWIERDPYAPPNLSQFSKDGKIVNDGMAGAAQEMRPPPTIWGMRKRNFWILVGVVAFVIVAAAVGGGVGGYYANHPRDSGSSSPANVTKTSPVHQNSSITAVQWKDAGLNNQYRVYFQYKNGRVLESAWGADHPGWNVSFISDDGADIVLGTPLTAAIGYPHVNSSNALVKNVYYIGNTGSMYERQSPYKDQAGVWGNDNFSGLYTTSKGSPLLAFWYQSFDTLSQILAVLFQEIGANSLTISKYTSNSTSDNPWVDARQSIPIQNGSTLATAPIGSRQDLRLYMGDPDGTMKQYQYNLTTDALTNPISSIYPLPPQTPLCISTQDNRGYYSTTTMPECARDTQEYTHLILFATPDRTNLTLVSWNCSSGFLDQTSAIAPFLAPSRTYIGLANTLTSLNSDDQRVYVLFDGGTGPEIEEWQVPPGAQHAPWRVLGSVPVNVTQP